MTGEERRALVETGGGGPWWAAFPHRRGRFRPGGGVARAVGVVVSLLVLAGAGLGAYLWRSDLRIAAMLSGVPTVLAFLWALAVRRRSSGLAGALLLVVLLLIPVNMLAVDISGGSSLVPLGSAGMAVVVSVVAARLLGVPAAVPVALGIVALSLMNRLALDRGALAGLPFGRVFEFVPLGLFALSAGALALRLYARRREADEQVHFGATMGLLAVLWSFAVCCTHLFVRDSASASRFLDPQWFGPWAVGLGAVLLIVALAFLRATGSHRTSPSRAFGITLVCLSAVAAVVGLLLADRYPRAMLVGLAGVLVTTAVLGLCAGGKGTKAFRAIASAALPVAVACLAVVLSPAGVGAGGSLLVAVASGVAGAVGLSAGAALVYLFGIVTMATEKRWTHSVPSVAGLALGVLGYFLVSVHGGDAGIAAPGVEALWVVPSVWVMAVLSAVTLVTAWRLGWQPAVYLGALGLLIAVGSWTTQSAADGAHVDSHGHMALWVAAAGAGLSLVGAGFAVAGRRSPLAKFYCEGLLVMGLAATVLMVLTALAGAGSWQWLLTEGSVALLASLAISLLVNALVFRQEDLFGFFGFVVVMIALARLAVHGGAREGSYLLRYQAVALGMGIVLALVAAFLAAYLRRRAGLNHFAAALYVIAFATAVVLLGLLPLTGDLCWRGFDLVAVAIILALIRPHVRHPATGYAVAAAVVAAIFQFVAARWGHSSAEMHQASVIAAGALSVALVLAAHFLRHVLLAFTHSSDKEARRRSRPFTVVGMTLAVALAVYLSVQTAMEYHRTWTGRSAMPWLTETFTPGAAVVAWAGVLLAFLVSIWLFRHSTRTFGFYLVGSAAVIAAGPVFVHDDPHRLLTFLLFAIGGYGAVHLVVYLWERPYMAMLSRICALYKDEQHASTAIFTASAISCFIGGILAAFHIYTLAALVMLGMLTVVFAIWSFGQRRAEFLYPMVLTSIGALLSVWHNVEGPGPWTPDRLTINAMVFAAGGPLWLGIGTALNRLRGPMSLLNAPARQMSVLVAIVSLGFFAALAVSPTWGGPVWHPDNAPDRLLLGAACGVILCLHFLWAAASFRQTLLVYLSGIALVTTLVFGASRIAAVWHSAVLRSHWPLGAAVLALATLGLGRLLERRRQVLFGRPLFYSAVFLLPLVVVAGVLGLVVRGEVAAGAAALLALTAPLLLGATMRARRTLLCLAALAAAGGAAAWRLSGAGFAGEASGAMICAAAAAAAVAAATAGILIRKDLRRR